MLSFNCLIETEFVLISCERLFSLSLKILLFFFQLCLKLIFHVHHKTLIFFVLFGKHISENFLYLFRWSIIHDGWNKWDEMDIVMPCSFQSVKFSVWSSRLLMWCIKRKKTNKIQSYVIRLLGNTKNPNFLLEMLSFKMNKIYHKNMQCLWYLYKDCNLTLTNHHCKSAKVVLALLKNKTRLKSIMSLCESPFLRRNWNEFKLSILKCF